MIDTETHEAELTPPLAETRETRRRWTKEEAVVAIRAFRARHGRPPHYGEFKSPGLPSPTTLRRLFKGTNDALRQAGVETPRKRGRPKGKKNNRRPLVQIAHRIESLRLEKAMIEGKLKREMQALEKELAR